MTVGRSLYGPTPFSSTTTRQVRPLLNSIDVYPPNARSMVTDERLPKLIFRIYRGALQRLWRVRDAVRRGARDEMSSAPSTRSTTSTARMALCPGLPGFVNMYERANTSPAQHLALGSGRHPLRLGCPQHPLGSSRPELRSKRTRGRASPSLASPARAVPESREWRRPKRHAGNYKGDR
jgi:hypothetical protein